MASYDGLGTPSSGSRNGIQASRSERAAAKYAPRRKGGPLQGAVYLDRLEGVGGTRRMETTPPGQQTAKRQAVHGKDPDERPAQGSAQQACQVSHQRISPASVNS